MSNLPRYYGIRKKHLISHLFIHTDKCREEMPEDNSIISGTPDPAVYKEQKKQKGKGGGEENGKVEALLVCHQLGREGRTWIIFSLLLCTYVLGRQPI